MNSINAAIDTQAILAASLVAIDPTAIGGMVSGPTLIVSIMAETERPEQNVHQLPVNSPVEAVADSRADGDAGPTVFQSPDSQSPSPEREKQFPSKDLPAHNFPAEQPAEPPEEEVESALDRNCDLWMYRDRTAALLRRYMQYSLEAGRLPSVLGSAYFRTRVTSYGVTTFEDRVIFVHDVETCLGRVDSFSQQILARIILQEYGHEQAAGLLGCARKTIHRRLAEALDAISEILLEVGLLDAIPPRCGNSCQGGQNDEIPASDCDEGK